MARLSEVARHLVVPEGIVSTEWPRVRAKCSELGLGFDEWQDGLGRLMFSKREDGLYACDTVVVSIPRQVGKTHVMMSALFALCLLRAGLTVLWTAHRVKTAKETFGSMAALAARDSVRPLVAQVVRGRGDEAVLFVNGSRILFGAREAGFGRGFADVGVLAFDEAQILGESALDDMLASQNVAENPLTLFMGTPPRPKDPGEAFTMFRQEALDGESEGTLYVELSADRGCDVEDREQWRKANPSYPHRTSERAMLRLRKNLLEDSFRREALGVWDEVSTHQAVVKDSVWRALRADGPESSVRPHALVVDMSHSREVSVGACWLDGDCAHVEEVWAGVSGSECVEWVAANVGRRVPVGVDSASPASSLVPELRRRGVRVVVTNASDMAKAFGMLMDRVAAGSLSHANQESVNQAVAGARRRPIRDAGGYGLDRRDETANIAPLVAVMLSVLVAVTHGRRKSVVSSGRGGFVL
ncbi:Terminase [Segniliparus rotundus DSM 44985]|uniref:Terminase n=1 Tax=Segniliparus rotundus (strain ATCC BAA-972 / CDC 1076 / CIP 108378 / DSM 44985 / JCM 13578) TaxID=640132 RepID=D6Z9M9_SEGRD|nr:terminase [Segniliparus rotundus]ADG96556.1 Terminase [Segniliparus rotundus DSM 44985]